MILQVNSVRCAHEEVDGEVLVIDTVSGRLSILQGSGPLVWSALAEGADQDLLIGSAEQRYGREAAEVVASFVHALLEQQLLVDGAIASGVVDWPDHFDPPTLETFDDIADILTLDPVHDVSDTGWPHAAE